MIQMSMFEANPDVLESGIEVYRLHGMQLYGEHGPSGHADLATIELQQHIDGRWMWATSVYGRNGGRGYGVMPKWGNFTTDHAAAKIAAIKELLVHTILVLHSDEQDQVCRWAQSI